MPEQLTIDNPPPVATAWRVTDFDLHLEVAGAGGSFTDDPEKASVWVKVVNDIGDSKEDRWTGQEAFNDIVSINKADLRVQTLQKRLLAKLVARGTLAGTVTGSPA